MSASTFSDAVGWALDVGFFAEDPPRTARERFPDLTDAELRQVVEIAEARSAFELADIERAERDKR